MPVPFAFVIEGPPVSQQARRRERVRQWRDAVRQAADQAWPDGALPVTGPLMVTILYFYESLAIDVDNLPKPILDALKGLVYVDDTQITDVMCRKRDLHQTFRVVNPSSALMDGLSRGQDFLSIVITEAPDHEVPG